MTRRDVIVGASLSALLVALLVPYARIGVDFHHDGIMLKPALDVLSGQVLFRDTFMQYGALTCFLQVAALWLQPTLLCLKLQTVAAYGVTLFFLYASWRLILPRSLTILSCALFILFIPVYEKSPLNQFWTMVPWSSVFAMMFQGIGLYALFRIIRGEQPEQWGLVLGLACACVFWCRQPVGVTMFGSLVMIGAALHWTGWAPVNTSRRSLLIRIVGGFVAVNVLLLGGIVISGALHEWWYQNFVWPRKWVMNGSNINSGGFFEYFVHRTAGAGLLLLFLAAALPALVRKFRPHLPAYSTLIYFIFLGGVLAWQHECVLSILSLRGGGWSALFPVLIFLQIAISAIPALTRRAQPRNTEYYLVVALALFSLGSLPQYYPIADPWHVLWSLAPAFGLLAFALWRWVDWPARVVVLASTAVFVPTLCAKMQTAAESVTQPLVTLVDPPALRGMKVPPAQAASIAKITNSLGPVLRQQPDIPSVMIGNDAMYLCFTNNHTNPSPYFVTWTGLADDDAGQKRWSYIASVRPLLILHKAKWDAVNDFYRRSHYVPLLYLSDEALEIAIPQELADAMGVTTYGATLPHVTAKVPLQP